MIELRCAAWNILKNRQKAPSSMSDEHFNLLFSLLLINSF